MILLLIMVKIMFTRMFTITSLANARLFSSLARISCGNPETSQLYNNIPGIFYEQVEECEQLLESGHLINIPQIVNIIGV